MIGLVDSVSTAFFCNRVVLSTFRNRFCLPSRKATFGPPWCLLRPLSRRSWQCDVLLVDRTKRLIQNQARLEPMCAAPDPRTDSNWACLRTPPFVSVAQIEKPASSFRPGRAGRVLRPPLVRSPPDSPIEPWSAILNADLFALRFPSEAT